MFQPILTVTIVTVNVGWNTGFSSVTDLNKGCSLLTMLKPNVWQGVCSSVRLDTDIFIVTSVLNYQTLKTPFLQILAIWSYLDPYGAMWSSWGQLKAILNHLKQFGAI